ncbi:PLD nuclease N-terminal domain-containing protein [Streptomyces tubercidicus]|uniref:PLD nuclease N-terminal domain-containing protein n=1 Tax=Streptomyces tubercidicus TaxID=47759 RepID=UPI002E10E574|nr:PLD nuclease N-terminal domain-containing protein [Streptomyces tubercidicus]WSX21320.1 PLD nuclease N-terminal domain-containing protein [Streptomyces tubercidicus]
MLRYLPFLLVLALWIYAFIDCLNTPESQVRGLPKVAWVLIVLLFGEVLVGPVAWLVAGKQRRAVTGGGTPSEWRRNRRTKFVAPDDNPEFLRSLNQESRQRPDNKKDEALLKDWEADLRRREDELRRKDGKRDGTADGPEDTPPATG